MADRKGGKRETGRGSERKGEREREREGGRPGRCVGSGRVCAAHLKPPTRKDDGISRPLSLSRAHTLSLSAPELIIQVTRKQLRAQLEQSPADLDQIQLQGVCCLPNRSTLLLNNALKPDSGCTDVFYHAVS